MLEVFRKLHSGSKPATAAALKQAFDEIDEATLAEAVSSAEADRRGKLLSGDDKALDAAEAQLTRARRDLDRGRAAKEELASRIVIAEQAEAAAALDAERRSTEAECKKVAEELRRVYAEASKQIVTVLERLEAAEARVQATNRLLAEAGQPAIPPVEQRVFPFGNNHYSAASVTRLTSLRPVDGSPGWGPGRFAAEQMALPTKA